MDNDFNDFEEADEELPEPECTCEYIDVDLVDARGCEVHGENVQRAVLGLLKSHGLETWTMRDIQILEAVKL